MAQSPRQALRFFVNRVVHQAASEGVPLSDLECQMLFWPNSDSSSKPDPGLPAALAIQISDEEYEAKIADLLKRAFRADVAAHHLARERWLQALKVLRRGDHYVTVIIEQALGARLAAKGWRQVWGLRAVPAALLVSIVLFALVWAAAMILGPDSISAPPLGEVYVSKIYEVIWVGAVGLGIAYSLVRLAFGGARIDGLLTRTVNRLLGRRSLWRR